MTKSVGASPFVARARLRVALIRRGTYLPIASTIKTRFGAPLAAYRLAGIEKAAMAYRRRFGSLQKAYAAAGLPATQSEILAALYKMRQSSRAMRPDG